MYERLGNFIVRHYRLVILVWIVILFYVFPLTFKINDVVVYQETETGLEDLEAMKVDEIINQSFAGRVPPSTLMVVIQNSNVLSPEVRDFSWALHESIANDSGLEGVEQVGYLYSSIESYLTQLAFQTAPMLYGLYDQTNQTAQMVFGVPLQIAQNHMTILVDSNYTLDDNTVMMMVLDGLEDQLVASGANSTTIAVTIGYAQAFYGYWLPSKSMDLVDLGAMISQASNGYFSDPVMGQMGAFALMVTNGLSISNFTSIGPVTNLTLSMVLSQVQSTRAFIESVWALGPTPTYVDAVVLARTTVLTTDFGLLPPIPEFIVAQFVNVRSAVSPNSTMLMVLPLNVSGSSGAAEQDVRILRQMVSEHVGAAGSDYSVYVSGDPALTVDIMDAVDRDTSKIDVVTVLLVIVLVGMFFRSAVTPWVPLMTVGMAFMTSTAIIYILGSFLLEIHYSVMTIVLTVMLGAGTDYCIFIMSRYREERVLGRSKEESVRTSLTWAGESITTSGATVMIGFGALMIGQYTLVRSMGMALVVAVGMALAFALTMLPSLLMLVGDRVFWPQPIDKEVKRAKRREERGGGYFRKSAKFSLKNRRAIVVAAVLISLPAAYLVLSLESSYDFIAGLPEAESKKGIDALAEGFGEGTIMPTYVLIRYDNNVTGNSTALITSAWDQVETYCVNLRDRDNVRSVSGPTRPFGLTANASYVASLPADERATYEYVIAQTIGSDNRTVMLTITLQDEPFTTKSIHTMDDIRKMNKELAQSVFDGNAEILVGGSTAVMKDVSVTVSNDFFTMRIVVLIGIYLVLMFVLGSLVIPLRLILTVLLSVSWTIALTMIVFQFASGVPVLWMMPLILFVVAMGLGMDYDIFLTTRIREEVSKGKTDEQAITTAVERTGGIITACGVVMAGAFGSMLLSSTALLREFGFGLSFAILLDAMVVRIYLVPAIMLMLQKWNWYAPGRLQRVRRDEKPRKH